MICVIYRNKRKRKQETETLRQLTNTNHEPDNDSLPRAPNGSNGMYINYVSDHCVDECELATYGITRSKTTRGHHGPTINTGKQTEADITDIYSVVNKARRDPDELELHDNPMTGGCLNKL